MRLKGKANVLSRPKYHQTHTHRAITNGCLLCCCPPKDARSYTYSMIIGTRSLPQNTTRNSYTHTQFYPIRLDSRRENEWLTFHSTNNNTFYLHHTHTFYRMFFVPLILSIRLFCVCIHRIFHIEWKHILLFIFTFFCCSRAHPFWICSCCSWNFSFHQNIVYNKNSVALCTHCIEICNAVDGTVVYCCLSLILVTMRVKSSCWCVGAMQKCVHFCLQSKRISRW